MAAKTAAAIRRTATQVAGWRAISDASARFVPLVSARTGENRRRRLLEGQPLLDRLAAQPATGLVLVATIRSHESPHGGVRKRAEPYALVEFRNAFI